MNVPVYNPWLWACVVILAIIFINGSMMLMVRHERAGKIMWAISILAIVAFLFFDGKAHAAIVLVLVVMFNGFRLIVLPKLMDKYGNIDIFACFKRKKTGCHDNAGRENND